MNLHRSAKMLQGAVVLWVHLAGAPMPTHAGDFGPDVPQSRRAELIAEVSGSSATADQLWDYIQKWTLGNSARKPPPAPLVASRGDRPTPRQILTAEATAENEAQIRICAACRALIEKFPADQRGSEARLLILEKQGWEIVSNAEYRAFCQQIIAAPDAPKAVHDRARYLFLCNTIAGIWNHHEGVDEVFADYERDYPEEKIGELLVLERLKYYSEKEPDKVVPMLRQLTTSPNKATAAAADRDLSLRTKPLELKFTVTDGSVVDVAKWRGRLVLLYFWASWGAPEKDLLPQVQALRRKYPPAQFQVLGINMDEERSDMRKAIKARQMNWPNGNDLVPGKDSAVARRFGELWPQVVWLLDREGVPHRLHAREELEPQVRSWVTSQDNPGSGIRKE